MRGLVIKPKGCFESGLGLRGHWCLAISMLLHVCAAAMHGVGADRAKGGQLIAFVEPGEDH